MTIDRDLWLKSDWFVDRKTPPWPCPWCKHGTLQIKTWRTYAARAARAAAANEAV